ncbi:MAG TPA: hypothetical protein VKV32_14360 [Stellaceae bacterium]|nr:hypothetical protein [Stellaceae bacterium]
MDIRCVRCGTTFDCDPQGACWCKTPPFLPVPGPEETCLCPSCLAKAREALPRAEDA